MAGTRETTFLGFCGDQPLHFAIRKPHKLPAAHLSATLKIPTGSGVPAEAAAAKIRQPTGDEIKFCCGFLRFCGRDSPKFCICALSDSSTISRVGVRGVDTRA